MIFACWWANDFCFSFRSLIALHCRSSCGDFRFDADEIISLSFSISLLHLFFFLGFTSCSTADCRHSVRSFCSLIVRWFSCHPLTCVSLCELLGVWWIIGDDDENKSESKIVNGKIISSSRIIYLISHFGLNALLRALADVFMDSSWRINLFMKLKYNNIMHISMLGKCCLRCESKIVEWNKRPAWRT